jgi:hypothetical protein
MKTNGLAITNRRIAELSAIADEDIDMSDIDELDEEFFEEALLTLADSNVIKRVEDANLSSVTKRTKD